MYLPTLVWPTSMPSFRSFAVNARRPPQRVFPAHGADQLANVFRNARTTALAVTDLPPPEKPKALPVPGYNGFRLDDNQSGTPIAPDSAQPRPKKSIGPSQFRLLHRPMQDAELVAECEILHLEGGSRFEESQGDAGHQTNGAESETEATTGGKQAPYSHVVRNLRQAQFRFSEISSTSG